MSALPASGVVDTAAVLNATVNPESIDTTYFFEYTTDAAYQLAPGTYQTLVAGGDAGAGSTARNVSAQLNGLQPNTTYHFRVDATNGIDPVRGADQTFTTAATPQPPVVASVQAGSITDTTAVLSGTVNPEGHTTSYYLEYGQDTGYGTNVPATPQSVGSGSLPQNVSVTLTNLASHTTYHYAIVADNAAGTGTVVDHSFTTTTPPSATTGSASAITGSSATVSGTTNVNGDPSTVYFQYGPTLAYGRSTLGQSAQGSTTQPFSDSLSALSTGTPYHFRIVAVNGPDITYGADQTFTTLAPPVLGSVSAQLPSDTTAQFNATIDPSAQATQYYVSWGTDASYSSGPTPSSTLPQDTGIQPVQIALAGLTADTTYHFQLVASNSAGTTYGPDQTFTTPMPPAVSTSPPTAITDSSATLQGSVTTHGFSTNYHFEYASVTEYGSTGSYPHTTASQPATDGMTETANLSQLTPATLYHYRLVATNGPDTTTSPDQTFTTTTPPSATTGSASAIIGSSATVSGTANANGDPATVYFQYGPTLVYGSTTPRQSLSGTTDQPYGATLSALSTSTPYHFRLVAVNGPDIAYGADHTFTTLAPPALGSASVQLPTDTTALLNATVDPSGQTTQYYVNWGTDTNYTSGPTPMTALPQDAGVQPVQISLTGLTANTTYHFQLVASNSAGTTSGPDQVFTTPMPPGVSTSSPTMITDTSATLQGSVTTNGFRTNYHFEYASATEYASSSSYPHTTPSHPAADGVTESANVSQLSAATLYHFRLVATNGTDTVASADQTFTTAPQPLPLAGTTVSLNVADSTATVAGRVNPRGYPATYQFQYGTSTNYGLATTPADAGSGTAAIDVSAPLTGLARGTTYYFRTVATNNTGTAYGDTQTFTTTTPPSAITGSASSVTGTSATVSGTANANGDPSTVYFQYGATIAYGSTTPGQSLSGTTDQPYRATLSGLAPGTGYHFRLVAVNGPDTTWGADQSFATLAQPVVGRPTASPTGDAAVILGGTIDPSAQATTYYFNYGSTPAYGSTTTSQTLAAGTGAQAVGASVTGLTANTTYHFQLVASNSAGTTSGPDQVFTTPMPPAASTSSPTMITDTSATLQGSVTTNGFRTNYHFEYASATEYGSSGQAGTYPHATPVRDVGSTTGGQAESMTIYQLLPGTTYHFRLVATQDTETVAGVDQTFTTAPQPPPLAGTTVSLNVADSTATVAGLVNPRGYPTTIQFQYGTSTNYGSATTPLNAGSGTAAIDISAPLTGLAPGTTYYFRTVATNSAGTAYGGTQTFTTAAGAPGSSSGDPSSRSGAPGSRSDARGSSRGSGATAPTIAVSGPPKTKLQSNSLPVLDPGLNVTCPASSTPCHVTVQVTTLVHLNAVKATKHKRATRIMTHTAILGTATVTVLPGHTTQMRITLGHPALTMLRASHKLSVLVKVALAGTKVSSVRPVLVLMPQMTKPTAKKP